MEKEKKSMFLFIGGVLFLGGLSLGLLVGVLLSPPEDYKDFKRIILDDFKNRNSEPSKGNSRALDVKCECIFEGVCDEPEDEYEEVEEEE